MHRSLPFSLLSLLLFSSSLLSSSPFARAADALVGRRVVVIKDQAPLAASGKEVGKASECTVFTVDKVDGEWLWIKSEKAYLRRGDVVLFEDAIGHYTRQLETNKTANNYWNRAQIWRLKGELDIALGDMNDAIRLNPNSSAWFDLRGLLWYGKKEYDKAIADYSEATRLDPKNASAYNNRGIAWSDKKDNDKAIADYDAALKHNDPTAKVGTFGNSQITGGDSTAMVNLRAVTFNNRGASWQNKGDYDKALADYDEAIRLDPKYQLPRTNRRIGWEKKGDWAKFDADCEATLKEGSPTADICNVYAWLRATCPDEKHRNGQQAVEYATKACELTAWKKPWYFDSLAAAYAEAGDFDKAVEWQKKSMVGASPTEKADFETRLKLYREQKPYRQPAP